MSWRVAGLLALSVAGGCGALGPGVIAVPYGGLETEISQASTGDEIVARYSTGDGAKYLHIPLDKNGNPAAPFAVPAAPAGQQWCDIPDEQAEQVYAAANWPVCWQERRSYYNGEVLHSGPRPRVFAVSVRVMPDGRVEESGRNHDPSTGKLPAAHEFLILLPGEYLCDSRKNLEPVRINEPTIPKPNPVVEIGTVAAAGVAVVVTAPFWVPVALFDPQADLPVDSPEQPLTQLKGPDEPGDPGRHPLR